MWQREEVAKVYRVTREEGQIVQVVEVGRINAARLEARRAQAAQEATPCLKRKIRRLIVRIKTRIFGA